MSDLLGRILPLGVERLPPPIGRTEPIRRVTREPHHEEEPEQESEPEPEQGELDYDEQPGDPERPDDDGLPHIDISA